MTAVDVVRGHLEAIAVHPDGSVRIAARAREALRWLNVASLPAQTEADVVDELSRSYDRGVAAGKRIGRKQAVAEMQAADALSQSVNGGPAPSRYGAEFDRLVSRWAALEREHDVDHPCRDKCGGVGGCSLMFAAVRLVQEMVDALAGWRRTSMTAPADLPAPR